MDFIIKAVNIVLPLFVTAAVGQLIGKWKWIDKKTSDQLNRIAFDILFPCSFFLNAYNGAGKINISSSFIFIIVAVQVISFIATYFIAKVTTKKIEEQGVLHQTMFRSNMILFGTAIANSLLASDERAVYTVALLVILPLQNIGSIVGKEIFGNTTDGKISFLGVVKGVASSSNVVAIVLGLIVGNLGIKIPQFLTSAASSLGASGPSLQLLLLGASLEFASVKKYVKQLTVGVIVKLFLMSALIVPFISFFNLSFAESFVLLLLCSAPTAVTTFTISMRQKWDVDLVNGMILMTTIFSLFTLTFWMYILQIMAR